MKKCPTMFILITVWISACSFQPSSLPTATPTVDFTQFALDLPQESQFSNPVWSPTGSFVAVSINGLVEDKKQTGVAVLDLKKDNAWWIHQYPSLDWGEAKSQWSPDSKWIAFLPSDAAFADDCGLWIFSIDGSEKHQFHQAQFMYEWSEDSHRISFQVKDFCGDVDITYWELYQYMEPTSQCG